MDCSLVPPPACLSLPLSPSAGIFSDVVSGHHRRRSCSVARRQKPRGDPSNFAPQISRARTLFCGCGDLIELLFLLLLPFALGGVGLVSNLSAATPHRATQSPTLFPPKRQPCRRALVAGPCSRNLAPFRESHL